MKLISLNIWGGQKHKELLDFINKTKRDIDIFCFQEVFKSKVNTFSSESKMNIYSDIENVLKDYQVFFAPTFSNYDLKTKVNFNVLFGEATFVRKSIKVVSEGTVFTYKDFDQTLILSHDDYGEYWDLPRNFHYTFIKNKTQEFLIANIHGFWKAGEKTDTKESLEQSDKIIAFLDTFNCPKILCGDFNLDLKTESIKKIENHLINLVDKHNVKNTRSKFYTRNEKFADYIFVSSEVKIKDFAVMDEHVSDHLPLYLDFS